MRVIVHTKYIENLYFHMKIQLSVAITGDDILVKIYIRQKYLSVKRKMDMSQFIADQRMDKQI